MLVRTARQARRTGTATHWVNVQLRQRLRKVKDDSIKVLHAEAMIQLQVTTTGCQSFTQGSKTNSNRAAK